MTYNVIIVDIPWSYKNINTGGSMKSGAKNKYNTMNLDEVKQLINHINPILDNNCILFFWATVPLLPEAFEVIKEWKFNYKTSLFWHKNNINGLGYYYRGVVEMLLMCIRGKIKAFRYQHPNIVACRTLNHSVKPDIFRKIIEQSISIKEPKFLELFATKQYKNWTCLGSNLTGNNIIEDINNLTPEKKGG